MVPERKSKTLQQSHVTLSSHLYKRSTTELAKGKQSIESSRIYEMIQSIVLLSANSVVDLYTTFISKRAVHKVENRRVENLGDDSIDMC